MRNKFILAFCKITALLIVLFLAREQAAAQSHKPALDTKKLSIIYVTKQAASVAVEQLRTKVIEGIAKDCTEDILNNISEHKEIEKSKKLVELHIKESLDKAFDEDLKKIYKSFKSQDIKFSEGEYIRESRESFENKIEKNISQNADDNLREIFEKARGEAVRRQLNRISLCVYPSQEDVENIDQAGWQPVDVKALKQGLKGKMRRSEKVLLEETERRIDQRIDQIIKDVKNQIEVQKEAIQQELPGDRITERQLKEAMENNVNNAIRKLRAEATEGRKIYDIFPSIRGEIDRKAKIKEKERFRSFCQNVKGIALTSKEKLKRLIRKNLALHKEKEKSRHIVVNRLLSKAEKAILGQYVALAPGEEQKEFSTRLTTYLPEMHEEIKRTCGELIEDDLENAREEIADEQLRRYFPRLADKSWEVPKVAKGEHKDKYDIMGGIYRKKLNPTITTFEKIKKEIKDEISIGEWKHQNLLEETEKKVCDLTNDLINEASRAWKGQWNIYLAHQEYIEDEKKGNKIFIKDEVKKIPKTKEEWVKYFTGKITEIWKRNRVSLIWPLQVPDYAKDKYQELFAYIKHEIEQRLNTGVGNIINEIEKEKEQARNERAIAKERSRKKRSDAKEHDSKSEVVPRPPANDTYGETSTHNVVPPPSPKTGWLWLLLILLVIVAMAIWYRKWRMKRFETFDGWVQFFNRRGMTGEPLPGGGFRYDMGEFEILIRKINVKLE